MCSVNKRTHLPEVRCCTLGGAHILKVVPVEVVLVARRRRERLDSFALELLCLQARAIFRFARRAAAAAAAAAARVPRPPFRRRRERGLRLEILLKDVAPGGF